MSSILLVASLMPFATSSYQNGCSIGDRALRRRRDTAATVVARDAGGEPASRAAAVGPIGRGPPPLRRASRGVASPRDDADPLPVRELAAEPAGDQEDRR